MAKLPNIIEKERTLWEVSRFVFVQSIKASKYSLRRYAVAGLGAAFTFLEFGALTIIVNEFATQGITGARPKMLIIGFVILVLSDIIPSFVDSLHEYFWDVQADDIGRYLQATAIEKRAELDIGTIEQPEFQDLSNNATGRGWSSFYGIINTLTSFMRSFMVIGIATVSLIAIAPLSLFVIVVTSIPTYFLEKKNAKLFSTIWKENAELRRMWVAKTDPTNGKNALTELKNFGLVKFFKDRYLELIIPFHKKLQGLQKRTVYNYLFGRIFLTIGFGIAFFLIIRGVYVGAIAVGSLVFSFGAVARFQYSVNQLFSSFGKLVEHKEHVGRIMDFYEMKPLIVSGKRKIKPSEFESLELRNVSFAYPGSERVVTENFSLTIKAGQNIAVVGLNGAGKTTLMKLIMRVYDPTEGEVLVNGVSLKEYNLDSWRACLGIMMQDYSTYSEETIAHNISLGDVSKKENMKRVEESAKESTAHDFIVELPEKYGQRVGTEFKGGVELSKGQKQKLVLARVFYRNAPIMILDEPTAAVDALSEDAIFKNLREKHEGQTRMIISHKFSNVRDSDAIVLVEHGKIIEQGTHDELMAIADGRYKSLFELQAEGYR